MSSIGAITIAVDRGARIRQPRGAVKINGVEITGWVSWEVDNNSFYQSDAFKMHIAIADLPSAYAPNWWASQKRIEVELFAGFPPDPDNFTAADLDSVFFGRVEDMDFEPAVGSIEVSGRDLSADLIDFKTSAKYPNNTSSQIAAKIAAAHGLQTNITATKTKVGRYYQIDNVRLQDERTEWDLLTYLAKEEGFVVYMTGKTLNFVPRPTSAQAPYLVIYRPPTDDAAFPDATVTKLCFSRSLTLARDIIVKVRSWNSKNKRAFTKMARAKRTRSPVGTAAHALAAPPQTYLYTFPGLSSAQAQDRANKILADLSQHEMKLTLEGPADNNLAISDVIEVQGTATDWDQAYFPDSIHRTMSTEDGYSWTVSAKNHSPESVTEA